MRDFPVENLKPLLGRLFAEPVGLSIEIPLAPFTIDEEVVETSIFLGGVSLANFRRSETSRADV
jgi:hypothetical protein